MNWRTIAPVTVVVCAVLAGCGQEKEPDVRDEPTLVSNAVTAEIQAGIEAHIDKQVRVGGGYFKLPFDDRELRLKLVRIHTEYRSNLGRRRHFACVDLMDVTGDVYDVDFFLSGDPFGAERRRNR